MRYLAVRKKHKLVHMPDYELKLFLKNKKKDLKKSLILGGAVTVFGKREGMKWMLQRHIDAQHRFWIEIDLTHAFHQITQEMISGVNSRISQDEFRNSFVSLHGKKVLPIGAPTSSILFELFMCNTVDVALEKWAKKYRGCVTRYADNILVTFNRQTSKNFKEGNQRLLSFVAKTDFAFEELLAIFKDRKLKVRWKPKQPRLWRENIWFCGIQVPKVGRPYVSKRRFKRMYWAAKQKDAQRSTSWCVEGVMVFAMEWGYDIIQQTESRLRQTGTRPRNHPGH